MTVLAVPGLPHAPTKCAVRMLTTGDWFRHGDKQFCLLHGTRVGELVHLTTIKEADNTAPIHAVTIIVLAEQAEVLYLGHVSIAKEYFTIG